MSYTQKPSEPPPFDATAFTNALASAKPLTPALSSQFVGWKRWLESTASFDGVDKGGLRDVLKALGVSVDKLKGNVDANSAAVLELLARVQALEEAPAARPFP